QAGRRSNRRSARATFFDPGDADEILAAASQRGPGIVDAASIAARACRFCVAYYCVGSRPSPCLGSLARNSGGGIVVRCGWNASMPMEGGTDDPAPGP